MFGGGPRAERIPAEKWDNEADVLKSVGEWLAMLPDDQAKFRVLTYWMWRLKSGDSPKITEWVEDFAEQSAADIAERTGFAVTKKGQPE
jgi:hypothetical protein